MGGVRKQAQWQSAGPEGCDAFAVFQKPRGVSCIDVKKRAQVLFIAAEKCRRIAHAVGELYEITVQQDSEIAEGVSLIQGRTFKELNAFRAKDLLQTGGDIQGLLAFAGNIEQEEDHASVDGLVIEKVSPTRAPR